MEIGIEMPAKHENIKSNAYWSRVHFDTTFIPDIDDTNIYKAHLEDCEKHPTTGLLAKRKYIDKKKMNYPECAWRNKKIMEREPEIDVLRKSVNEKINKLYPRTKNIRKHIINTDRVVLDFVKPKKHYGKLEKLLIALRKFL